MIARRLPPSPRPRPRLDCGCRWRRVLAALHARIAWAHRRLRTRLNRYRLGQCRPYRLRRLRSSGWQRWLRRLPWFDEGGQCGDGPDPPQHGRGAADERGAATVLVVALSGVLMLVAAATGVVGALVLAHRTAQAAADLAALAGAAAVNRTVAVAVDGAAAGAGADTGYGGGIRPGGVAHPGRDPCVVAASIAVANGADLRSCHRDGPDVVVTVAVRGPQWLAGAPELTATARAGPASG